MKSCVYTVGCYILLLFGIQVSDSIDNQLRSIIHVKYCRQRVETDCVQLIWLAHYYLCEFVEVFLNQRLLNLTYVFLRQFIFKPQFQKLGCLHRELHAISAWNVFYFVLAEIRPRYANKYRKIVKPPVLLLKLKLKCDRLRLSFFELNFSVPLNEATLKWPTSTAASQSCVHTNLLTWCLDPIGFKKSVGKTTQAARAARHPSCRVEVIDTDDLDAVALHFEGSLFSDHFDHFENARSNRGWLVIKHKFDFRGLWFQFYFCSWA